MLNPDVHSKASVWYIYIMDDEDTGKEQINDSNN